MEIYIDMGISQSRGILIKDNKPLSIYIQDFSIMNISGNIYKGRVENIVESLGCAFVNIGEDKCGMLHTIDATSVLKKGDEILVQVTREPSGDKGARLSMHLSIPSANTVLLVGSKDINISRKIINPKKRKELFNLGKELTQSDNELGIIFRTQCEGLEYEEINDEYNIIKNIYIEIEKTWKYIKGNALLFESSGFLNYIKREYINPSIKKIYINREDKSQIIREYIKSKGFNIEVSSIEEAAKRVDFTKGIIDLFLKREFNTDNGDIIVDEAEAFTIIDVNYKFSDRVNILEESILSGNLSVCNKIAQVISLKCISGIILIDFVNMKHTDSRKAVIDEIENCFKTYNIKAKIHGFTRLGILEISRAKKSMSLRDAVYDKGNTLRPLYLIKALENEMLSNFYKCSKSDVLVYTSEEIYDEIERISFIESMKDIYNINVKIEKIKDFRGYYIQHDTNENFARISIGKRSYVGNVEMLIQDDLSLTIKILKQK
ncbi:MAG: ribonuclease E/G [Clostridium sp.]